MNFFFLRRHALPIALFSFTVGLRLVALWRLSGTPYAAPATADMAFYAEWAQRIIGGQWTDYRAFYGQPLYAYLLAAIFGLAGFQPLLVGVIQAVVDAVTSVIIFKIALLVFRETPARARMIGVAAGAGWALFVPAATYSTLLIPASWMALGWWACVWWLLRHAGEARPKHWFLIAACVGVMAMMSATILFAAGLLLAAAARRRSLAAAAAVGAGVILGTAPAWLHNTLAARDPVFLSAHSGLNFWIGNNPEANGYPRVPRELPSEQAALLRESVTVAEAAAGRKLPRSAVSSYWSAKAHHYIASRPLDWSRLIGAKAKNFWNRFEYDDLSSVTVLRDAGVILPGLRFGFVAALGLAGGLMALRVPRARWVLAAIILQMLALLPVFVNERYRISAAPGLLLMSAYCLTEFWRAVVMTSWASIAAWLALLTVSTAFVSLPPGEHALLSLDDYKTARRQLLAGDHQRAELRLRRALTSMVSPPQVAPAIANAFAEAAEEKLKAGHAAAALATIEEALRLNPASERLRNLRSRIAAERGAEK